MGRINQFFAILAQQGIFPHEEPQISDVLNQDIQTLLNFSDPFLQSEHCLSENYAVIPAVYYCDYHSYKYDLCRSRIKKAWDNTRHFVKEHKKEILIGAAIVVAVAVTVTVVVMTCGTTSGGAAAVAEAIAGLSQLEDTDHSHENNKKKTNHAPYSIETKEGARSPMIVTSSETPLLREIIEDQISSFREIVSENMANKKAQFAPVGSLGFLTQVRDAGSYFAHETFDMVTNIVSEVPRLIEEMHNFSEKFLPISKMPSSSQNVAWNPVSPVKRFEDSTDSGHRFIDKMFNTEQAKFYTQEAQENSPGDLFTYAVLPPPGTLSGASVVGEGRLAITQCNSTWGWKIGDPIQNRTWWGGQPKWSTVRQRHWKNRALELKSKQNSKFNKEDVQRMENGLAPQRYNDLTGKVESMELHHIPP
ncbi:MAG TPA: hypothetical protein VJK48_06095 [Chlamydiales bacterium]|nr:MAG: hypothetical protein A3F67_07785 [Verrucomicrobia bacterium RIFCSPHIGHO2_12_FULL_41_10]HLB53256.1 hypothetical protein [Chlamydiales bacterium]